MIYTCGIIGDVDREETLEELQDNKLAVVCQKIDLQKDDRMLDIGCGWGTLVRFASEHYGAKATGVTLARNQTAWGNNAMRRAGVPESQSNILCMDYRDIPVPEGGFNKITCLEMSEHVGVRHFHGFLTQIYNMLDDDGVFFMQYAGIRKAWQYEDLLWGLFMNKYVFPGADASTPLGWTIDKLEGAGFEVKGIDTIGVHYSATLWRWYRNWLGNRENIEAKYGKRWFRVSLSVPVTSPSKQKLTNCRPGNSSWLGPRLPRAKDPPLASRLCSSRTSTRRTVSAASRRSLASAALWSSSRPSLASSRGRPRITSLLLPSICRCLMWP